MGPSQEHTIEYEPTFSIPKLSSDGLNWVTFKTHFLFTMGGHDIEGHFDRSETPPHSTHSQLPRQDEVDSGRQGTKQCLPHSGRKCQCDEKIMHAQLAQVVSD